MYDPAIARFTSVDPIADQFPHLSTFNYAENRPINGIDLHGLQFYSTISGAAQAEALHPESAKGLTQKAMNYEKVSGAGTVVGIGIAVAIGASVSAGSAATLSFIGNEIKDELLSQATGGASDVLDVTKMATKGVKKLISNFSDLPSSGSIDPSEVMFSQNSIKGEFSDGGNVSSLTEGLKDGSIDPSSVPAIRVVEHNGSTTTLDNRRLKAFQDAGVDIPFQKLDAIPDKEKFKFTSTNGGTSVKVRGQ